MCVACTATQDRERKRVQDAAALEGRTVPCPSEYHYYRPEEAITCDCFLCGCGVKVNTSKDVHCGACHTCNECCHCYTCNSCGQHKDNVDAAKCTCCGYCPTCCHCRICDHEGCGEKHQNDCSACEKCGKHCAHVRCPSCSKRVGAENICPGCHQCYGKCCSGASDNCKNPLIAVWMRHNSPLRFHESRHSANEFSKNRLTRLLACEIEMTSQQRVTAEVGAKIQALMLEHGDNVVEDGSVNGWGSREINTMPANGNKFVDYIDALGAGLKQAQAGVTSKCGVHIHVDTRNYTTYDLRRLITVYQKVERALYELCNPSRLTNTYSVICGADWHCSSRDPKGFRAELVGKLYGPSAKKLRKSDQTKEFGKSKNDRIGQKSVVNGEIVYSGGNKQHRLRYRALNLHSHFLRGSVEFRHHEGSVDPVEIKNWALVCGWVVESAYNMSESMVERLSDNPYESLIALLPKSLHKWVAGKWASYGSSEGYESSDYDSTWQQQDDKMRSKTYAARTERHREFIDSLQERRS